MHDVLSYVESKSKHLALCDNPNAGLYLFPLPKKFIAFGRPELVVDDRLKDLFESSGAQLTNHKKELDPGFASREWWIVGEAAQDLFTTYRHLSYQLKDFANLAPLPFQARQDPGSSERAGWKWLVWPWRCNGPVWWQMISLCSMRFDCNIDENSSRDRKRKAGFLMQRHSQYSSSYSFVYDASVLRSANEWLDDVYCSARCPLLYFGS